MNQADSLEPLWAELRRQQISTDYESSTAANFEVPEMDVEDPTVQITTDTAAVDDGQAPQTTDLPPYEVWPVRGVPQLTDREKVTTTLCEIVSVEGPVTWRRVIDLYRQGLGLGRLKGPTRDSLVGLAKSAVRLSRLLELSNQDDWYSRVVSTPEAPKVRLRQRGPRDLQDVPADEIAA